jgi:hypothetical protein
MRLLLSTVILATPACLALPSQAFGQQFHWDDIPRVVVFGDVHGAYAELVELLQATTVVNPDLSWAGGDTHVVSLGDLVDRGPDSRAVIELLMRLQTEAVEQGGRVHVVLGNHELMTLTGDLRYVSPGEYREFAAEETIAMRDAAFAAFPLEPNESAGAARARFDAKYPLGYLARQAAFAVDGLYGAWLLSLPAAIVINEVAYMHGGPSPIVAQAPIESLNGELQDDLRRYLELRAALAAAQVLPAADRERDLEIARSTLDDAGSEISKLLEDFIALGDSPVFGLESPLWYRGSVYCKPILEEPIIDSALAQLRAARVVVGHTPTADRRVQTLYEGKVLMLDTGMLGAYYGGRPAALVLDGEAAQIQYLSPPERVSIDLTGAVDARALDEAWAINALAHGTVTSIEASATRGPSHVALRHHDGMLDALFYPRGSGGDTELAAAALDELLGASLIAPTVARTIDGTDGALQLRYSDAVTEAQRLQRGLGFSGWCPIEPQLQLMYAFDLLASNRGRSADNVAYTNDLSDLTLTDHRLAFGTERALPAAFDPASLAMPVPLADTLRALDEPRLRAALGDWLDTRRIRALLARRDRLVGATER